MQYILNQILKLYLLKLLHHVQWFDGWMLMKIKKVKDI